MGRYVTILAIALAMVFVIESNSAFAKQGKRGAQKTGKGGNPKAMFEKMDANSDGKVTKDEFVAAKSSRAKKSGKAVNIEARFAKIDANSDGSITLPEWRKFSQKTRKQHAA